MKKDILAIITFVTTGVLFYLIQVGGPPGKTVSVNDEIGVVEEVYIDSSDAEEPKALLKKDEGVRDS